MPVQEGKAVITDRAGFTGILKSLLPIGSNYVNSGNIKRVIIGIFFTVGIVQW